jgi:hypothetical protein
MTTELLADVATAKHQDANSIGDAHLVAAQDIA